MEIIVGENSHLELDFQSHWVYWCVPFGSTITRTFPMQWPAETEGKYLVKVWLEELPPWCVLPDPFNEKIVTIGNFHDVAITSLSALDTKEKGDDLLI